MKLFVSDYDGTICIDGTVDHKNISSIKQWQDNGNLFAIATGRDLRMARYVIEKYNIPFDLLICNNGSVVYDSSYEEIMSTHIPIDIVRRLIKHKIIKESYYIALADKITRYVVEGYHLEFMKKQFFTKELSIDDFKNNCEFYQIDTMFKDKKTMNENTKKLIDEFGKEVQFNINVDTMDITPLGISKCSTLNKMIKKLKLNDKDVFTVGDGLNDLEMITHYNGYTVNSASQEVKQAAVKVVEQVYEIINEILIMEGE